MRNILLTFIMGMLLITFSSALLERSVDAPSLKQNIEISESANVYPAISVESFLGYKKADLVLTKHDSICGENCMSEFTICTAEESSLVDDLKVLRLNEKGDWVESKLRSYNFQYYTDVPTYENNCGFVKDQYICTGEPKQIGTHKDWIEYNLGEVKPADCYDIKLLGQKRAEWTYDWQITTQGKLISEWATWGNISTGSQAEVVLISPSNNYQSQVGVSVTTNASGQVLSIGESLTNISLYDNSGGSWALKNTTNISSSVAIFTLTKGSTSTESASPRAGLSFTVTQNATINNVTKDASSTADRAYLYISSDNDSGNLLATATFSGNVATFDYPINTSSTYFVLAGLNNGSSYTRTLSSSAVSYPQTTSQISVNGFVILDSGGLQTNNYRNIIGITTTNNTLYNYQSYTNNYSSGSTITWNYKVCSSSGTCGFATSNRTFFIDNRVILNSFTYNSSTFETANETFIANISANSSLTAVNLNYNGTLYPMTNSSGIWTSSFNISTSNVGTVPIYLNYSYGGSFLSSSNYSQNVSSLVLALCNSTYTTRFLNITFKDESTLGAISATIPTSTFDYYLGSGIVTKSLNFINTSANLNYSFCSNAVNSTLNVDPYVQYAGTGYPQRIWNPTVQTYNNTTTTQTLYLLSSSDGIYVTFQVINAVQQSLSGVEITAIREITGANVTVASGTTGADGTVTFWLNPDFSHDFSFIKTGFTTYETSFAPTQTSYTIQLTSGSSGQIVSNFKGVDYTLYPLNKTLVNNTAYTFGINLSTSSSDVSEYGFNLRLANGTIITGDSTVTLEELASVSYNTNNQTVIYMDYYWIVNSTYTNRTQKFLVFNSLNTQWSIGHFFQRLQTYMDVGFFGLDDFGRYLIVFIIIFVTTGVMSYKYGLTSPIQVTFMIFVVVFFLDVVIGLIPNITLYNGREVKNILTFLTGIIFLVFLIKEGTQ